MYRDAPNSARFSTLKFGIWVLDLKAHLQAQVDGTSKIRYFHNVRFFFWFRFRWTLCVWLTSFGFFKKIVWIFFFHIFSLFQIGHDSSISPLLGFLQISEMVWPGMWVFVCFPQKTWACTFILRGLSFFFWRGAEVNITTFTGFASSLFLIHLFSRSHSSFIIKIRNTSSVFSGVVNQWKPPLLWVFLTWSLLLTSLPVRLFLFHSLMCR